MKLSMSLIAKYLEQYHPECHILNDTLSIKGVRFLSAPHLEFSLEYIYLGLAEGYYQDPRYADALLLANGENQIICRGADYEELLNEVLSAFDYFAEFEQKLFLASTQHLSLGEMLPVMEAVLDCTLLVFDVDGHLLSGCGLDRMEGHPVLPAILSQNRLSFNGIGAVIVDGSGKITHDLSDTPQYLTIQDEDEPGCVAMYLYQDVERIGFIMIFVRDDLQIPMCLNMASMLGRCCANASEFTDKDSLRRSNNSIFMSLLNGEALDSSVLEKFEADVQIGKNAVLIVFQGISIRNYTFHKMLINEIRKLNAPCIACEHEGRIAILTASSAIENILRLISAKIASPNISLGISMPFQDLNKVNIALAQALLALNASSEPGIRYCRDLALSYLLQALRQNEMSAHLLHPALDILTKYDAENDTELFHTMEIYVRMCCNQTDTANTLHVHLNTLKYRLNRIRELTQVDFRDWEDLFYIWLSLKLNGHST